MNGSKPPNFFLFVLSVMIISTCPTPITFDKQLESVDNFNNTSLSALNQSSATSILDFMKENAAKIQLTPQKDIILMLGNSGAGKSTLTAFLTGTKLESIETLKDSGEFVLVDKNDLKSQKSTTTSNTIVPDLMIDMKNGLTFYDCPGFGDTRGVAYDISVSYLIKQLINRLESVKLVFAVSFSSVRNGGDRHDFMELVNYATNFIKDIEKYKNGIALVVTKVDNRYVNKNNTLHLVDDDMVIATIALFLKQVKINLENNKQCDNVSVEENELNDNKIKFIETLLGMDKQTNKYTRIGIFRLADQIGSTENMPILQNERKTIISMIDHKLQYIEIENDDFGYAISEKSKNQMHELMYEMQQQLNHDVSIIGIEIENYFLAHKNDIPFKKVLIRYVHRQLLHLKTVTPKAFADQLTNLLHDLGINQSIENLNRLRRDIEAGNFLRNISNISFSNSFHISNGLSNVLDFLKTVCLQLHVF